MNDLAVEALLSRQPGVIEVSFRRSERGAVLGIFARVENEIAADNFRRVVENTVGPGFARDRLEIVNNQPPAEPVVIPEKPAESTPNTQGRIRLLQVATSARRGQMGIEVSLSEAGMQAAASEEGPGFPGSSIRLAAKAALSAASQLHPELDARLDHMTTSSLSTERVVLVAVAVRNGSGWKRLLGIAGIGEGTPEAAAARAVLGSLNRIVS